MNLRIAKSVNITPEQHTNNNAPHVYRNCLWDAMETYVGLSVTLVR